MKYAEYTVADFVADEYFERWVNRPDAEVIAFWEAWVAAHPEKKAVVEEARDIIRLMTFRESKYSKKEASHLLRRIHATLDKNTNTSDQPSFPSENIASQKSANLWYQVAAVLALLTASTVAYLFFQGNSKVKYTTGFGEKKIVMLPDSSKVTLNANSTLHYQADWSADEVREVFLDGEAFFEVRKQPLVGNHKFVVHTQQLNVEVLGTQFNVSEREGITRVTLNEGVIKLNSYKARMIKDVMMEPGEQAELTRENTFEIRQVNPERYTAWKDNKLVFENTTIQEIASIIAHNYGLEMIVLDTAIFEKKFTGTLPGNDIDIILKTFSEIYGLDIDREQDQIFLSNEGKY